MNEKELHNGEKEAGSFRLIATLGIAGFLSGLILVSVYLFTKPIIAQNKADALKAAVFEVLPQTASFKAMAWDGQQMIEAGENENTVDGLVYFGYDSTGRFTGVAIPGEESGYQDIISAIVGYDPGKRTIIGFKVLDSKETPGLGDKIIFDEGFKNNFRQLEVDPEVKVVKRGEKTAGNQIEAITGATISSNAIGRLIQESMSKWKERIDEYMTSKSNEQN